MNTVVSNGRKIGILGGTFDPIHRTHLRMAVAAKEQFGLDEVWLMPSGNPPHKDKKQITPGAERLEMIRLAVKDLPGISASSYELERSGKIYTAETLKRLTEQEPGTTWYFILGGDSLLYLDQWFHAEEIFRLAVIVVAARLSGDTRQLKATQELFEKKEQLLCRFPYAKILFLDFGADDVSSTEIRECIHNLFADVTKNTVPDSFSLSDRSALEHVREMLPEPVLQYIIEKGFYRV